MRALLLLATTCVGLNGLQPPRAFQPVVSLCPGAASPVAPRVCLSRERGRRASSLSLRKTWGYGTKEYWDDMYRGEGELPADEYSWYCGWAVIQSFWEELVPDRTSRVLVPGVGNDATIADMWDAGWRSITAFDYSADAVVRAGALFGERQLELLRRCSRLATRQQLLRCRLRQGRTRRDWAKWHGRPECRRSRACACHQVVGRGGPWWAGRLAARALVRMHAF